MRILVIGGSGTISSSVVELLLKNPDIQVFVLNRGRRSVEVPEGVTHIIADAHDPESLRSALKGMDFDVACHFMGYELSQIELAADVLSGHVGQFIFISSASAYAKPMSQWYVSEEMPLGNPYWDYSRKKQASEEYLFDLYRKSGFPVTVVRPSHTYCEKAIPVGMHGKVGKWQVVQRMLDGKPIIVHGDGTSLWTMTDSRDFAKGFVGLVGNPAAIGQAYHITTDESLPWDQIYRDIAWALSESLGRKIEPVLHHVASETIVREGLKYGYDFEGNLLGDKSNSFVFDNSKIKAAVPGFKATISHREGTLRAVQYVLSHPELQIQDPEFDAFCDHLAEL